MRSVTTVEICVDDVAGVQAAERAGADRVELCASLVEGGITPSIGMVAQALEVASRIAVHVLIRPRGGDFAYDSDDLQVMLRDIAAIGDLPRRVPVGFVVNALTRAGQVDEPATRQLVEACAGLPVTFSRAFDETTDLAKSADTLAGLGVDRILTGGGRGPASGNLPDLRKLVDHTTGRIGILAAGSIRSQNVSAVVSATGATEVHLRAPQPDPHDGRPRTSEAEIRAVLAAVNHPPSGN